MVPSAGCSDNKVCLKHVNCNQFIQIHSEEVVTLTESVKLHKEELPKPVPLYCSYAAPTTPNPDK